ncbi:MAG: hypothetical protein KGZ86_07965 [Candidatus Latescibacteria bacterium]|nr:hypothetical protein [Candidatus Latescibacterota bacterium]
MAQAKAFEAETQYGVFALCLRLKRLTELIIEYDAKGKPIPSFIKCQPVPVVRIYRIIDGKQPSIGPSNKGKPPSEGGASPLVSHNESEKPIHAPKIRCVMTPIKFKTLLTLSLISAIFSVQLNLCQKNTMRLKYTF